MPRQSSSRRGEKEAKRIFEELMMEMYPNLMKNINLYIPGAQQTPSRIKLRTTTPQHITFLERQKQIGIL